MKAEDDAMERRAKIESMLIKDREERSEENVK